MKSNRFTRLLVTALFAVAFWAVASAGASAGTATRVIVGSGTTSTSSSAPTTDGASGPELDAGLTDEAGFPIVNREQGRKNGKFPHKPLEAPAISPGAVAANGSELAGSFAGLNFRQQRRANGGNQFSVEPPDQALCAANGQVLEAVNDVIQAYDSAGVPQFNGGADGPNVLPLDLNTFFGYPAAINRTTLDRGPSLTDPI